MRLTNAQLTHSMREYADTFRKLESELELMKVVLLLAKF